MTSIKINDKISYIKASENPLSADVGIINVCGATWLYDVGSNEDIPKSLCGEYNVVLSHFHTDHIGNIDKIRAKDTYLSATTYAHVHRGTVVDSDIVTDDMHIFPLPSSHAKGCLGLEVDGTYAFVGDALYCKVKDGGYAYNAQLLKDEIEVLKNLRSRYLLVSHHDGFIREKDEVIAELDEIYKRREKNAAYIMI